MWKSLAVTAMALAGILQPAQGLFGAPEPRAALAPLVVRDGNIPDRYILVFGNGRGGPDVPGTSPADADLAREAISYSENAERMAKELGAAVGQARTVGYRYRWAVIGFSLDLPPAQLQTLRRVAPGISWIESDGVVLAPPPEQSYKMEAGSIFSQELLFEGRHLQEQLDAPIGLDRLGQKRSKLNERYAWSLDGSGVHVYVVDTGILATHKDMQGRVLVAPGQWYNATSETLTPAGCSRTFHGTRVASIIGGKTYGVAKRTTLHPVIVFGCAERSSNATITAGVEWVLKHYSTAPVRFPAVANLSLEVPVPDKDDDRDALFQAVANSIDAGITFAVAAGNNAPKGDDACYVTPARVPGAITVASSRLWADLDLKADTSNYGTCVDAFAPGVRIRSAAGPGDSDEAAYPDATSFAAPHAAGLAALYLQNHRRASAEQVRTALLAVASTGSTSGWCGVYLRGTGSPNVLLHWGAGSDDGTVGVEAEPPATPCPTRRAVKLWLRAR